MIILKSFGPEMIVYEDENIVEVEIEEIDGDELEVSDDDKLSKNIT